MAKRTAQREHKLHTVFGLLFEYEARGYASYLCIHIQNLAFIVAH